MCLKKNNNNAHGCIHSCELEVPKVEHRGEFKLHNDKSLQQKLI